MKGKLNLYNLSELEHALNTHGKDSYKDIMDSIRFNFKDIEHLCFWDPDHYSKINIGEGKNYELMLICWEKKQYSSIHKHEKEEAWTYVLKGEITEKIYQPINGHGHFNLESEIKLNPKKFSCINNNGRQHELINSFDGRSVSLHLYID